MIVRLEVHRFYGWLFCLIVGHTLPIETVQNGQRIFRIEFDLSTFIKGTEFKPEDIQVTGKMGEVIIKARSEHCKRLSNTDYLLIIREYNKSYSLPQDADVDNVRFHLKNDGFLVVEVPLPQIEAKADQEMPQE